MQIKEFNKANLQHLREAIDQALAKVAEDFDLHSIKTSRIGFQNTEFSASLTARVKAENNEEVIERQKIDSAMLGYSDNIVGRIVTGREGKFEITGFNMKRPKWPILAKSVTTEKEVSFQAGIQIPGVIYKPR